MNIKKLLVIACCFILGATSCDKSEEKYGDLLTAHPWYVGGIDYSYEFYSGAGPDLVEYVEGFLRDDNIFFFPGDMLMFSGSTITAECPDGSLYNYRFDYDHGIRIDRWKLGCYFDVLTGEDNVGLRFSKSSLIFCLMCERDNAAERYREYWESLITEAQTILKEFYIIYRLQADRPVFADYIDGVYEAPVYDGTGQLVYRRATLNLFWTNKKLNLSLDDKIQLENGPEFYIQVPDVAVDYGFAPGSFTIEAEQTIRDSQYGDIIVRLSGQYNANNTLTVDFDITNSGKDYKLRFLKGTHIIGYTPVKTDAGTISLKPAS